MNFKKIHLYILFSFLTLVPAGSVNSVKIYSDVNKKFYGRAPERLGPLIYNIDNKSYQYLDLSTPEKTALVISLKSVETLRSLLSRYQMIRFKDIELTKEDNLYSIFLKNNNIKILFSFEKPDQSIINLISDYYIHSEYWSKKVKERYNDNYIIVIHGLSDFNNNGKIDYQEIIVAATLLASRDQWLWGIHDGVEILDFIEDSDSKIQLILKDRTSYSDHYSNKSDFETAVNIEIGYISDDGKFRKINNKK